MKLTVLKLVMSIMYPTYDAYTFQDQELVYNTVTQHGYPRKIEKVDGNIWFLYSDKVYELTPEGHLETGYLKTDSVWVQNR
jgi:hypothetical protein